MSDNTSGNPASINGTTDSQKALGAPVGPSTTVVQLQSRDVLTLVTTGLAAILNLILLLALVFIVIPMLNHSVAEARINYKINEDNAKLNKQNHELLEDNKKEVERLNRALEDARRTAAKLPKE